MNRSPYTSIYFQIPEEGWSDNPVDYFMLKIFGCPMFAYVKDRKLAPRTVKCMFLAYASESKGYRMCYPDYEKVIQSTDVTFNEKAMSSSGKESVTSSASADDQEDASRKVEIEVETATT